MFVVFERKRIQLKQLLKKIYEGTTVTELSAKDCSGGDLQTLSNSKLRKQVRNSRVESYQ